MKRTLLMLALFGAPLQAAPDTVDTAFSGTGGSYYDAVQFGGPSSMLIQPDGKLLVGSNEMPAAGGTINVPLVRFNLDGTVDNTFFADNDQNGSGSGIYYDAAGWPEVHGLAMQSDGKIIAVGCMQGMRDAATTPASTNKIISNGIVRILPTGEPDSTFQTAGIDTEFIDEVITTSDDKIIIAGGFNAVRDQGGSFVTRYGIARLNADGSLDSSFQVTPAAFGNIVANSLFIRQVTPTANGKYYIVGSAQPVGGSIFDSTPVFARLNSDGSRDGSFAPIYPSGVDTFIGVVLEPSGKIVALGSYGNTTSSNSYMARFTDTGTPDNSFSLPSSAQRVGARPLRVDPLGRYLLFKRDPVNGFTELIRLNSDGTIDPTFNASGISTLDPLNTRPAYFNQAITSPVGKIYAGGGFTTVNGEDTVKIVAFEGDEVPNSPGTIQLGSFAFSATECDGSLLIPVVRIGGATGVATVNYTFSDINSTAGSDYTGTSGTVTFGAGIAGTQYITVPLVADSIVETIEVFTVTLTNATGATLGTLTTGNAAIIDSNSPPEIFAEPTPLYAPPFTFFQLAVGALSGKDPTTYQWFKDGNPISGATLPLYFVTNANAAQHDGDYTVVVTNPNGSDTSAVATVVVKYPAELSFTSSTTSVVENDGTFTLTVSRGGSSVGAVSANVTLLGGTATAGADFTAATSTVSWADGDSADKTVTFTLLDDTDIESEETFTAIINNLSLDAVTVNPSTNLITLLDDDAPLTIITQPSSLTLQEDEVLTLTVAADSQTELSYQWLLDGSPLAGQESATLTIDPITLSGAGSYTVEVTNAAGTITSDAAVIAVTPAPYLTTTAPDASALDIEITAMSLIDNTTAWVGGNSSTQGYLIQRISTNPAIPTLTIPLNNTIEQLVTLPDGGVAARGFFTSVNGISQSYVARINPDGTLASSQITSGLTNLPTTIAVDGVGRILVGEGGGADLRRFNTDGSLDTTFAFPSLGSNPTINAITVDGTSVYVGGRFTSAATGNYLTKLNDDGSRDASFNFGNNHIIYSIRVQDDGEVTYLGTVAVGTVTYFINRVTATGSTNSSANNLGSSAVFDFELDQNSQPLVPLTVSPFFRRLLETNLPDNAFNTALGAFNGPVKAVEVDGAGRIWLAGNFTDLNGNAVAKLVILNGDPAELAIVEDPVLAVAEPGADASFSVKVISSGTIGYQWRKNGSDLPGETSATLTLTGVTTADAADYDVVVTNLDTSLSLTSTPAELVVLGAPIFVNSPPSTTLIVGNDLTLEPTFYALAPATYQWQKGGVDIPSANGPTYEITSSTVADSGLFTLTVTNSLGSATSIPANIQFIPDPAELVAGFTPATNGFNSINRVIPEPAGGAYLFGNYSGLAHPNGTFANNFGRVAPNGDPATFTATSNQFIQDLARDSQGRVVMVGSNFFLNGASRRLARISAEGVSDTAFDTNAANDFSTYFRLAIDSSDRIYVHRSGELKRFNSDGTVDTSFTATIGSGSPLGLQVDGDDNLLVLLSNSLQRFLPDGTLDASFVLDSAVPVTPAFFDYAIAADGSIHLAASDFSSSKIYHLSPTGTLISTINNPGGGASLTAFALQTNGKYLVARNTVPRLFRILPNGTPDPLFNIGTGFNSTISALEVTEDGNIWVSGAFSQLNGNPTYLYAKLNGDPVDVIISSQPINTVADLGSATSISVTASGLNSAPISYQWRKNGSNIPGATTDTLTFDPVQESDEDVYDVVITNQTTGRERTSASATLTVLSTPEILTLSETTQELEVGDALTLTVEAQGAGSLSYQWKKDGNDILGADSPSYEISSSAVEDSGIYTVVITNNLGFTTSQEISVTVILSPAALSLLNDPLLTFGGTVYAVLPLPDGRTLVGGSFSSVTYNGGFNAVDDLALLNSDGSLDSSFDMTPNGAIYSLELDPQGRVLVGGQFNFIGGQSRPFHVRLDSSLAIDATFGSTSGPNQGVRTFKAGADGKYYLGGTFAQFNGDTDFGYLVRLDSDGNLDTTFNPPALNFVYTLIPLPSGQVIAGGNFTGLGSNYVARFNADGSYDASYPASSNSNVYDMALQDDGKLVTAGRFGRLFRFNTDGTSDNSLSTSVNSDIWALEIDAAGKLLIGGNFNFVNGVTLNRFARLNSDGTTDSGFPVGESANNTVEEIRLLPLGGIWIGGSFSSYRGTSINRLALLNGDPLDIAIATQPQSLTVDPGTTATFTVVAAATGDIIYQWQRNGVDLVDGGDISGAATPTLNIANTEDSDEDSYRVVVTHSVTNEQLTSNSAELLVLGAPEILTQPTDVTTEVALSATFRVTAQGASPIAYQWYRDGAPLADSATIAGATTNELILSDLELIDSGSLFLRINNGLGSVDSDTVNLLVERPPASIDYSLTLPSFNNTVRALQVNDDGSFIAGGNFTTVTYPTGSTSRRYLAKINPDGSPDLTFPQTSLGNPVYDMDRDSQGRLLIAGGFTRLNANGTFVTINRVARINTDGTVDTTFDPLTGPDNTVYQIRTLPNDQVLITGPFTSVNGLAGTRGIARLNSDGTVDTTFVSQATSTVEDVILVGSNYWIAGGGYPGSTRNALLDSTGALVSSYNYNGNLGITDIIPTADGGALTAGTFYPYIEKIAADGTRSTTWPSFANGAGGPNNRIYELAQLDNNRSILAGQFSNYSGTPLSNIGVVDSDGIADPDFDPGLGFNGSYPEIIKVDSEGRIWCGGSFTNYNGEIVGRIVVLNGFGTTPVDPITAYYDSYSIPQNQRADDDDTDGDRMPLLLEYLYGLDPSAIDGYPAANMHAGQSEVLGAVLNAADPGAGLVDNYPYRTTLVRIPKDLKGLTYELEASRNLRNFNDPLIGVHEYGTPIDDGDYNLHQFYFTPDVSQTSLLFWRLRVERE